MHFYNLWRLLSAAVKRLFYSPPVLFIKVHIKTVGKMRHEDNSILCAVLGTTVSSGLTAVN
jgi:hypothetical protein